MVKRFLKQKIHEGESTLYLTHQDPLRTLEVKLHGCRMCRLVNSRRKLVFGEGNPSADLLFVGEAPGKVEDKEGRPFVGRAGVLLREILKEIGIDEDDIYITNIVKCHPSYDRDPQKDEIEACRPYFMRQLKLIKPEVIVALGRISSRALIGEEISITKVHGQLYEIEGIKLIPVFHPAFIVRNPNMRQPAVRDLIKAKELLK